MADNPQTTLPPTPREPLVDTRGRISMQWERWLQQVQRILSFAGGIAWQLINKGGSKLDDIEVRTHDMLQSVLGWSTGTNTVQTKHISDANGKAWQDHVETVDGNPHGTDHDQLDGKDAASQHPATSVDYTPEANSEIPSPATVQSAIDILAKTSITVTPERHQYVGYKYWFYDATELAAVTPLVGDTAVLWDDGAGNYATVYKCTTAGTWDIGIPEAEELGFNNAYIVTDESPDTIIFNNDATDQPIVVFLSTSAVAYKRIVNSKSRGYPAVTLVFTVSGFDNVRGRTDIPWFPSGSVITIGTETFTCPGGYGQLLLAETSHYVDAKYVTATGNAVLDMPSTAYGIEYITGLVFGTEHESDSGADGLTYASRGYPTPTGWWDNVKRLLGRLTDWTTTTIEVVDDLHTHRVFGTGADNTTIEDDGTIVFNGGAVVWEDMQFGISSGKVGAANVPTWETFTTNSSAYSFAVNDYIDLGANEPSHGWKEGTTGKVHLHIAIKTAQTAGADRFAKFTVYIGYADVDEVWTETSVTAEITIPDGTAALTHQLLSMGDLVLTNNLIGTQIKPRLKRIAATSGTEYAANVFVTQVGMHMEHDTVGSREIATK